MAKPEDQMALCALSDALADAARLHDSATAVADDPALSRDLSEEAERLHRLSAEVRNGWPDDDPGTMLRLIDELRLAVDHWFGDDDKAARTAGRDARGDVLTLIDDHLRNPELSVPVRAVFTDVRARIAGPEERMSPAVGLKAIRP